MKRIKTNLMPQPGRTFASPPGRLAEVPVFESVVVLERKHID